jgi:hypothetical protein
MKPSSALVKSGLLQLEKPKELPQAEAKLKYAGALRFGHPGQNTINKQHVGMEDDVVDPENEDSFEDDKSAEDAEAM